MRMSTRRNLLRASTACAVFCAAAAVMLPAHASAATTAESTTALNVRSGPSTSYSVVDVLYAGEQVTVEGCQSGWCYITHSGPDGYVSSSYLTRSGGVRMEPNFNLSFSFPNGGISIGNGGVSIGIGDNGRDNNPGRGPGPGRPGGNPGGDHQACFFTGPGYTGDSFCMNAGDHMVYVGAHWNNRISSISNRSGLRVTVCDDSGYDICETITGSVRYLGSFDNRISSIRVAR